MSFYNNRSDSDTICDVWSHNLCFEFKRISRLVAKGYNFVALDTEFPGIIGRPLGEFTDQMEFLYQMIRCNVNLTKVIQIGLTLMDSSGHLPGAGMTTTWQFNLRFNLMEDMYAENAIRMLTDSGLQFNRLATDDGIDSDLFAELLMASGLVLTEEIHWISFHGGYDFAHLLKLLTNDNLPPESTDFNDLVKLYFPIVYDIKFLLNKSDGFTGSLQDIANQLRLGRIGCPHQAGSDSYIAGKAFFELSKTHFGEYLDQNKYNRRLYGLDIN